MVSWYVPRVLQKYKYYLDHLLGSQSDFLVHLSSCSLNYWDEVLKTLTIMVD